MIRVNDDWVILVEPTCYSPAKDMHRLKKVKKDSGEIVEVPDYKPINKYFVDIKGAVRAIANYENKQVLMAQDMTLTQAINLMDDTRRRFEKILEGIKE